MIWENSIETCILSSVKQISSPGWMHETSARGWCTGMTQGMGWRGRWEGGFRMGNTLNPWLIHVNVWQKPLQYCKVISLQLIKINGKKKRCGRYTYICNGILLSHKNKCHKVICCSMDGPRDYHSEWSKSDREMTPLTCDITFITYNYLHVKSKKMIQMNLFIKQKQTHRHRKQTYINSYQRGKERGWIN